MSQLVCVRKGQCVFVCVCEWIGCVFVCVCEWIGCVFVWEECVSPRTPVCCPSAHRWQQVVTVANIQPTFTTVSDVSVQAIVRPETLVFVPGCETIRLDVREIDSLISESDLEMCKYVTCNLEH